MKVKEKNKQLSKLVAVNVDINMSAIFTCRSGENQQLHRRVQTWKVRRECCCVCWWILVSQSGDKNREQYLGRSWFLSSVSIQTPSVHRHFVRPKRRDIFMTDSQSVFHTGFTMDPITSSCRQYKMSSEIVSVNEKYQLFSLTYDIPQWVLSSTLVLKFWKNWQPFFISEVGPLQIFTDSSAKIRMNQV